MESKLYETSGQGPLLFIRHGETAYNTLSKSFGKEITRTSRGYLDCELNENGEAQAQALSKKLSEYKINYAFSSPALRCLQTCLISLKSHPEREQITIFVHPFLCETVSGVNGFCLNIREKKKNFNFQSEIKFDWSIFDSLFPDQQLQDIFFLNFIKRDDSRFLEISNKLQSEEILNDKTLLENKLVELSSFYVRNSKRPESLQDFFERSVKFKAFIREFITCYSLNEKIHKIPIFTHSGFTRISSSQFAYDIQKRGTIDSFPKDCYQQENCEITTIHI